MKRVNVVVTCAAISWALGAGCSVFEAPLPGDEGSGGQNGDGGGESGGAIAASGGRIGSGGIASGGKGGPDSSVDSGGTPSSGGAVASGGASSGGAASGGKSGTGGKGSTEPFWLDKDAKGCTHARLPTRADRPTGDPGEDRPPIILAVSRARHGASKDDVYLTKDVNGWVDTGFDMDGTCTSSSTCEVDEVPVRDTVCTNPDTLYPQDGNLCRDNAIGKIINVANSSPSVGEFFGLNDPDWNCELRRGGFSNIFKISKYNGKLNDDLVRVDVYTSTGLQVGQGWDCRIEAGEPLDPEWPDHAIWPKNKHWKIADVSIDLSSQPADPQELPGSNVYDQAAFVRNGYLVAYLPNKSVFWWNGENTPVPGFRNIMNRPVLVAKLIETPEGAWRIDDGVLTSIVLPDEMIRSFREIGYCGNMCNAYGTLISYLNSSEDMLIDPSLAGTGAECDGLSIAIDFEAEAATATKTDIVTVKKPVECPHPKNPKAPRQGCKCQPITNEACSPGDLGDAG